MTKTIKVKPLSEEKCPIQVQPCSFLWPHMPPRSYTYATSLAPSKPLRLKPSIRSRTCFFLPQKSSVCCVGLSSNTSDSGFPVPGQEEAWQFSLKDNPLFLKGIGERRHLWGHKQCLITIQSIHKILICPLVFNNYFQDYSHWQKRKDLVPLRE